MTTEIKTEKGQGQHADAGPNLGGPTYNPLAIEKEQVNYSGLDCGALAWVARYQQLNGGA